MTLSRDLASFTLNLARQPAFPQTVEPSSATSEFGLGLKITTAIAITVARWRSRLAWNFNHVLLWHFLDGSMLLWARHLPNIFRPMASNR